MNFSLVLLFSSALLVAADNQVTDFTNREVVGNCVNELCPPSYKCTLGVCHRAIRVRKAGAPAIGPCINTKCPDEYICEHSENLCYSTEPASN
ncbi:hypothetical protein PFISCL1PPCAC_15141 [Pristionchus fissidentatus]|uniref:CC domain-containing protein n=1 Tax=Pristionchus fissidentatus TaxID=1538716 RepID=A0AAV5W1Q0_9BILA|nr:hypothetical protein PFISCL1PPCAC_15141 [Pristionchus fissidentatus]